MRTMLGIAMLAALAACCAPAALAQLSVHTTQYGSKPGYIDQATLVVQPHGACVEQSLYLTYGDHGQFAGNQNVEIVHRFRLPANAVVNDLWLWFGDSIMQAIMLNTWRARAIYDSITSSLHDPALLQKTGDLYELHVFPLVSGSVRRVKLTFLTPTRWVGKQGYAELPLSLLKGNNAATKPVDVQFRYVEPVWGTPTLTEFPGLAFTPLKDSLGTTYLDAPVDDISALSCFSLGFSTDFHEGTFFASSERPNDGSYFQFGLDPGSLFPVPIDSSGRRICVALDLSGMHHRTFAQLIPKLKQALIAAVRPIDSVEILAAGAGLIAPLTSGWTAGDADSIAAVIDRFADGAWGKAIARQRLPHVHFADKWARDCWGFSALDRLAAYKVYSNLAEMARDSLDADVIASYGHWYEDRSTTAKAADSIVLALGTFLRQGGRFLTYLDYNRKGDDPVTRAFIPGAEARKIPETTMIMLRDTGGIIGMLFPETFSHYEFDTLQYDADPDVKVDVRDAFGRRVVVSKRVDAGLVVLTSIWSFRDDDALKEQLGTALLGLNGVSNPQLLKPLLDSVRAVHLRDACDRVIVISNSDSLFPQAAAQTWTQSYVAGLTQPIPAFITANLVDGTEYQPAYITVDQVQYYSAGYLLKSIADATHGRHFETHLYPWDGLCRQLDPYQYPRMNTLSVTAVVDGGAGQLKEIREVDPIPEDPNKARFFIGATTPADSIRFDVDAEYAGIPGMRHYSGVRSLSHDTTRMDGIVPQMLGNEHLKDLFAQPPPLDTAAIVAMAMRHNLLCDFTALIALEPNDTLHFKRDPEGGTSDVPQPATFGDDDSSSLRVAPNPFTRETMIAVNVADGTAVTLCVYDMLGRRLRMIVCGDVPRGVTYYRWDGRDERGVAVRSGIYFVHLIARHAATGTTRSALRKILRVE
jgi:hypothetical protein